MKNPLMQILVFTGVFLAGSFVGKKLGRKIAGSIFGEKTTTTKKAKPKTTRKKVSTTRKKVSTTRKKAS